MSAATRETTARATSKNSENSAAVAFSDDERAAMKEHARELKTAARRRGSRTAAADGEADVLAKIAEMADADRALAERIHALVRAAAPSLSPKLWYGMPAYARDGKIVCFFQSAAKFKARYATLGFNDAARLDDGAVWPTAFALATLSAADEKFLGDLVKRAAS